MDAPAPVGRLTAAPPAAPAATVAFRHLTALWVQITGTFCNLQCVHCINASGPREPWLWAAALGAHQLVLNCAGISFMVPLGLAQAATVFWQTPTPHVIWPRP